MKKTKRRLPGRRLVRSARRRPIAAVTLGAVLLGLFAGGVALFMPEPSRGGAAGHGVRVPLFEAALAPGGFLFDWLDPDRGNGDGRACLVRLKALDVDFEPLAGFTEGEGGACSVRNPVRLSRIGEMSFARPIMLTCGMAERLERWMTNTVQPAAVRLRGVPVTRLSKIGGYSCRSIRGQPGQLSEHGHANAIDIGSFILADGTDIAVGADWTDKGTRGAFLQEIAHGACATFRVTLTPDHDANHKHHFHLDAGRWRLCGVKGQWWRRFAPAGG